MDAAEAALDATLSNLSRVRENLQITQERYDLIVERLNDRAVEAFMSGPSTSLDFLLGATSITDLSDRFEYVDAVARSDADLAQEAQSAKNVLLAQQGELQVLRSRHRDRRRARETGRRGGDRPAGSRDGAGAGAGVDRRRRRQEVPVGAAGLPAGRWHR